MNTSNIFDLLKLYKEYFDRENYFVNNNKQKKIAEIENINISENPYKKGQIFYSKTNQPFNKIGKYGQDIWHSIKLNSIQKVGEKVNDITLDIDVCTISVKQVTNIVSTPLAAYPLDITDKNLRAKGCVNEIVNIDDWMFTIRGFLIGENRTVPEDDILKLKYFFETTNDVLLNGGYVEMFLDATCLVRIIKLEFPEVQGQAHWIRPFVIECKSNFIEDLKY